MMPVVVIAFFQFRTSNKGLMGGFWRMAESRSESTKIAAFFIALLLLLSRREAFVGAILYFSDCGPHTENMAVQ